MLQYAVAVLRRRPPTAAAGAWLRLPAQPPRRPISAALALAGRPEVLTRRRPPARLPPLAAGARCYARMARRIPPARPEGYSTSDDDVAEPEAEEELEMDGGGGDGAEAARLEDMEGFTLDFGDVDGDEEEEEDDDGVEEEEEGK